MSTRTAPHRAAPGAVPLAGLLALLVGGVALAGAQDPGQGDPPRAESPATLPPGPPRLGRLIIAPRTSGFFTTGGRRADLTFGSTIDRPALVRLQVLRMLPGRRRGRACVAPARALVRAGARPCRRLASLGVVRRRAETDFVVVLDGARVGRRVLGPGVYRVRVSARAGRHVSSVRTGAFRILPPAR